MDETLAMRRLELRRTAKAHIYQRFEGTTGSLHKVAVQATTNSPWGWETGGQVMGRHRATGIYRALNVVLHPEKLRASDMRRNMIERYGRRLRGNKHARYDFHNGMGIWR